MRCASAVTADQQIATVGPGDLGDRLGEDLDVISRRVRPRSTGAQLRCEKLLRVVAPHAERMEPEGPFERRRSQLLLTVSDHDRGIDIEHHGRAEVTPRDLGGRDAVGQLCPHVSPSPCPRDGDLLQPTGRDLVQGAPHRRWRGDRTQYPGLMAQHVDVGDRLTAIGEHHRDIDQDPATVVDRGERVAGHRRGETTRQAGSVGQQTKPDTPRVGHHADTVTGHGQPTGPRSTLHLRSAFQAGDLEPSQVQVSPAGQALPCFYAPITPRHRERSGLGA